MSGFLGVVLGNVYISQCPNSWILSHEIYKICPCSKRRPNEGRVLKEDLMRVGAPTLSLSMGINTYSASSHKYNIGSSSTLVLPSSDMFWCIIQVDFVNFYFTIKGQWCHCCFQHPIPGLKLLRHHLFIPESCIPTRIHSLETGANLGCGLFIN